MSDESPDLPSFLERAEAWLAERRVRRASTTFVWNEGDFDVTVFHNLDPDAERRQIEDLVAWHQEKLAAGFAALTWPEQWGGRGYPEAFERAFADLESGYDVPTGHELFSVTTRLIAPTIARFGTEAQQQRFVERFLAGDSFCCQLFSEPGAGSDLAAVTTRAESRGSRWRLNGQKVWSSGAHLAEWGLALCRTDPELTKHAGLTAFLVPLDAPGVEIRPIRQMSGGASFNEVFLSDVEIDDELRLGDERDGWKVALTVLGFERASSGSTTNRGGDFVQLLALARSVGRQDDPLVRQQLARVYSLQKLREWSRARAAATARAGQVPGPEGSIGKLLWTIGMAEISAVASSLLGMSLAADTGAWGTFAWSDHILGAPGYRVAGGTDEVQRNIIGERVLGLPPEPRVDKGMPYRDAPR